MWRPKMFTAYARLRDPELGDWVAVDVAFPNSMVDRITPVTTDEDRAQVAERFGVDRRLAGGLRALHPVGAGGQLHPRPAGRSSRSGCRWSPTSSRTS